MRSASRIVVAVLLTGCFVAAQNRPTAFDVVSIKPAGPSRPPLFIAESLCTFSLGRFNCPGATVRGLVRLAFQAPDAPLQLSQIVGGPGWIATSQFDIRATFAADQSESDVRKLVPALVRALLEDRFKLKAHADLRPFPVYALVKARKDGTLGPRLHASTTDCPSMPNDAPAGLPPPRDGRRCFFGVIRSGTITSGAITMDSLARNLTTFGADRVVVDRTGLSGMFELELRWSPDPAQASDDPPLVTALQEQLGLKLEPRTERLAAVVIDSVESLSPN
jgi:bla regulator protein BlaR1